MALMLLAGIPGGVALAAALGANRTDTVIDRLVAFERPPDVYMVPFFQTTKVPFAEMAQLPQVEAAYKIPQYGPARQSLSDLEVSAFPPALLTPRIHLVEGRLPRADAPDEALITFRARDRFHWHAGTTLNLPLAGAGTDPLSGHLVPGPTVHVHIVGIVAAPGDFVGIAGPGLIFGPAFPASLRSPIFSLDLYTFRLKRPVDRAGWDEGLRRLSGGKPIIYADAAAGVTQVRRAFHVQAVALWTMCAFLGLVTAFVFGQSLARDTTIASDDLPTLGAMGMSRGSRFAIGMARAGIVAAGAMAVGAAIGIGLSALTPLGTAHLAEPHPGPWVPGLLLIAGLVVIALAVLGSAVVPAMRAASLGRQSSASPRVSPVARFIGAITRRPAPGVGARFALEPGRGPSSVPVRSALTASVIGIVSLLAALTVGASLHRLLVTPRLYGWNWDLVVPGDFSPGTKDLAALQDDPAISAFGVGTGYGGNLLRMGDVATEGFMIDAVKGDASPTMLAGRTPTAADEIAVGPKTLRSINARIGSVVPVGLVGTDSTFRMRVVGTVVLPFDDDTATVGEGVYMTLQGGRRFLPSLPAEDAALRFAPGVDHRATAARLRERFQGDAPTIAPPQTVRDIGRMSALTAALAGILALLAAGTLMHMLTTSIKRRRRDVAILKTLGFDRRQVFGVIGWQSAVFTALAVALAVPLGALAGRWAWILIARYGGFSPSPGVPAARFALVAAASLAGAILLALLPARSAAATKPALVLRAE